MEKDYKQTIKHHLRLTCLRFLLDQDDYAMNESLLMDMVAQYGFSPSRDSLRVELAWLAEQGLVTLSGAESCQVATLTERGEDVAKGRARIPGVRRPSPGSRQ